MTYRESTVFDTDFLLLSAVATLQRQNSQQNCSHTRTWLVAEDAITFYLFKSVSVQLYMHFSAVKSSPDSNIFLNPGWYYVTV